MNQKQTTGIILRRTNYGEADRIITLLTPEAGKLTLMARGVRRIKSKLAGGIELFSISQISYLPGRGEIGTLVSSRLIKYYDQIIKDIDRTMLGYELIKQLNKVTEDQPDPAYFDLMEQAFVALDDSSIDIGLIKLWFGAQLLRSDGFTPNLRTDKTGNKLQADGSYDFGFEETSFTENPEGNFKADDIKFLRLLFNGNSPKVLQQVSGSAELTLAATPLVQSMLASHLRISS
ncbi:MAG: DNA repair protein RecO [Candidatus Saccharimonadales bacterium]